MPSKWMVDVKGKNGEAGQADIEAVLEDLDFSGFIEKQGSIASSVQSFIISNGYSISDSGGSVGSWHLGVPFDDLKEAADYLTLIGDNFARAIRYGIIRLELKSWSKESW